MVDEITRKYQRDFSAKRKAAILGIRDVDLGLRQNSSTFDEFQTEISTRLNIDYSNVFHPPDKTIEKVLRFGAINNENDYYVIFDALSDVTSDMNERTKLSLGKLIVSV